MDELSRRSLLAGSLVFSLPVLGVATPTLVWLAEGFAGQKVRRKPMKTIELRGFGKIRAESLRLKDAQGVSVECEDAGKADLLLGKYLSDLAGIGVIDLQAKANGIPAWTADKRNYQTAFRQGPRVTILSAIGPEALASAVASLTRQGEERHYEAKAAVPMYLNRWDRHGLLFYYFPFLEPPGFDASKQQYDYKKDFDFTEKDAHSGMIFWDDESANDTAEGMMNVPWWRWARNEALVRKMPVHVNTTAIPTTWLLNRYREENALKMPQFSGSFYRIADPYLGGNGVVSWGSQQGMDAELGLVQSTVREFKDDPNVVGWLEPHSELGHGKQQLFLEFGPASDHSYREFLHSRYSSLEALNSRRGTHLKSWGEVKAPELAEFLGWNSEAFDLTGTWRVRYEDAPPGETYNDNRLRGFYRRPVPTQGAPEEWFQPSYDDTSWGQLTAPGDDRVMFLQKRPAVYRRRFDWSPTGKRTWLYVWNLNMAERDHTLAYLNGQKIGDSTVPFFTPQWCAFEVTSFLKAGQNDLALRLPNGYLGYRVYLSTEPPRQYPHLSKVQNARWVDFADWTAELRHQGVGRGAEMIRQVDPDRPITFMSPDVYVDVVKDLCERYGGSMHDTGLMAAFWCDLYPMLARGSNLPFDLEPGNGPANAEDFRLFMGRYLTEGVQGLSYFMHVGDVIWRDDVRAEFGKYLPMLSLMGKHHIPKAEVALLFSQRCERLLGYPWGSDVNSSLPTGYWSWNVGANLLPLYPRDGLTELDFSNGNADDYRVVIDTCTTVMDQPLLDDIERWVRKGGVFVAFMQSGRHSTITADAWPISRLTGYMVAQIERYGDDSQVPESEWRSLLSAVGQDVFQAKDWGRANGLRLRQNHADCRDLLLWEDGAVAVGMRPLGKGTVIHVGAKFAHSSIPDRIDVGGDTLEVQRTTALFKAILDWRKIAPVPGSVGGAGDPIMLRHSVSNNGLFDVWTLYNRTKEAQTTTLHLTGGQPPVWCRDVRSSEEVPTNDLKFEPLETRAFITPREGGQSAPMDWLELQTQWWRGTQKPASKKLPIPEELQRNALNLTDDWAFLPLDSQSADVMVQAGYDDSACERRPLGVWGLTDHSDVRHAVLRKRFTVPKHWDKGLVELWLQSWTSSTFIDQATVYLDGERIGEAGGIRGDGLGGKLKPGSPHVLAIETKGEGQLRGVRANAWLSYNPKPQAKIDLAGEWIPSREPLFDEAPTHLPGKWDALIARRSILVPNDQRDRVVVLTVVGVSRVLGAIVNGRYVRRHHHGIGERTTLNVTPWIRFGQDNEIEIVSWDGPSTGVIKSVELHFFDRSKYA